MSIILYLLLFLLSILFLILFHELGHFITARWAGVAVRCFAIGFGKPLWRWQSQRGTEYVINIIPLGGYVRMLDEREAPVPESQQQFAFNRQSLLKRCIIIAAGPLFNILLAIGLYWLVFVMGINYLQPFASQIIPSSIAAQAGMQAGDRIMQIDQQVIHNWRQTGMALVPWLGKQGSLPVIIQRGSNSPQSLLFVVDHWQIGRLQPRLLQSLGIIPLLPTASSQQVLSASYYNHVQYRPWRALTAAWQETYSLIRFNVTVLGKLLTGTISLQSASGPIGMYEGTILAWRQGLAIYLDFLALLSVSLAILNLLPIPGLDGAQLLYLMIETWSGKPVSVRVQVLAFRIGAVILILLLLQGLLNDLQRL